MKYQMVYNLTSARSGREVPNQFVVDTNKEMVFQSYRSVCAIYNKQSHKLTLGEDWNYSRTTSKYFWQFVRDYLPEPYRSLDLKGLRKMIENGDVVVLDNHELEKVA